MPLIRASFIQTNLLYLGHVCFKEELKVIGDDTLGDGVDVVESIPGGLEGQEPDQTYNLNKSTK